MTNINHLLYSHNSQNGRAYSSFNSLNLRMADLTDAAFTVE